MDIDLKNEKNRMNEGKKRKKKGEGKKETLCLVLEKVTKNTYNHIRYLLVFR